MRPGRTITRAARDPSEPRTRNFIDCLKSRNKPNSDVEIGHASTTAAHL
jgi:hypothetical protein